MKWNASSRVKFITHIPDEVYYFSDELIYYHSHLSHVEKQKNGQSNWSDRFESTPVRCHFSKGIRPRSYRAYLSTSVPASQLSR